ncbi:hypothetical protein R3W88_024371 [Solanum pinnatisectum]|uniref:DUF4283 domain-containing protein n=1 Tax=Solanum pinnatisectum TaxID=50273 RepID=A0AAV9M0Y2_9SOLN|nr:hypothetical protein R3W88_024371 [Solanum pinnatisectum]
MIVEEIDDSSVEDEIHLENTDGKETPNRRVHFSFAEMSRHPTPAGDSDKVLYHDDGYYVFIFRNIAEKENVMQVGPYFDGNKPMILTNWDMDFELDVDMYSQIPIWVKFPRLPVGYWSGMTLSKVSSANGIPLVTDRFTAKAEKISYVRVLIEVYILKVLRDAIVIETLSGHWNQSIGYEWRPKFYNNCIKLGHMEDECWFKHTQKNVANISDEATETPMVAQPSNEPDFGQRSGRQHVADNISIEGIAATLETDPGQMSDLLLFMAWSKE